MSTHPYIPLYVDDYDAHTSHLSPAEDGVYMRLLRLCWRTPGCSIPNDHAWIARKIRLSADQYEEIARPVLDEFFKLSRGRLVQKRLKGEYDDISRKKLARQKAGRTGGEAKARKTKENTLGNATNLPAHARAFPEPEPEPVEVPPNPPEGDFRDGAFSLAVQAYPEAGRLTVSLEAMGEAWDDEIAAGATPAAILAAAKAFAAGQYADGGGKVPRFDRWLRKGLWKLVSTATPPVTPLAWNGPPDLLAGLRREMGEDHANGVLRMCRWDQDRGAIVTSSGTVADLIRKGGPRALRAHQAQVLEERAA